MSTRFKIENGLIEYLILRNMETKSLIYQIFDELPQIFFELIDFPPSLAYEYEFKSPDLKAPLNYINGIFVPAQRSRKPIFLVQKQFSFKEDFYYQFFTEIFLYLGQKKSNKDWLAVIIYPRRSVESAIPRPYQWLIESSHVKRVYLDELGESSELSLGLGLLKLIAEDEATVAEHAKQLIPQAKSQEIKEVRGKFLEFIEAILVSKFPQLSRQEIGEKFGLT